MKKIDRIKVLHLINSYSLAGAENLVFNIAKGMDKSRFDVFVCGMVEKGDDIEKVIMEDLIHNGVKAFVISRKKNKKRLHTLLKLISLLRENKIDIVHTHCSSPDFYGGIAGILTRKSLIFSTIHNTDGYPIMRERLLLSCITTQYIAISKEVKKYAVNVLKIPPKKIKIIYNGIPIEKFKRTEVDKKRKLKELGVNSDCKIVTTIGRITEQKGYTYFVKAIGSILKQFPDTYFLIIGDYTSNFGYVSKLKQIIRSEHVEGRVIFTGVRQDIPEILKISDVFVLSSLWEGFVTVVLEAMAAGVPVVATDVGSIREVIDNGSNGMIIPPKDNIAIAKTVVRLLKDKEHAERIAVNGEKSVETFSIENTIRAYEQLYLFYYKGANS